MVKRITAIDKDFINNCLENLKDGNRYTTSSLSKILGFLDISNLKRNKSFEKLKDEKVFVVDGTTENRENIYVFNKEKLFNLLLDDIQARTGEKIKWVIT